MGAFPAEDVTVARYRATCDVKELLGGPGMDCPRPEVSHVDRWCLDIRPGVPDKPVGTSGAQMCPVQGGGLSTVNRASPDLDGLGTLAPVLPCRSMSTRDGHGVSA